MIYTLTLNPALDYDVYLNDFQEGQLNISKENKYRVGGKGINVSIMLNNLNVENIAYGYIGGFTGKYLIENLNNMNVHSDFIEIEGTTRINVKLHSDKKETEIAGVSPVITNFDIEVLINKLKKLTNNDILILSGSIPSNLTKEFYKYISENIDAKTVLDTRGSYLLDNVYNNILIKPNIDELEEVFNTKFSSIADIKEKCKIFFEKGVEYIMISRGAQGAYLMTKDKMYEANVPKGKLINSVGAGDSTVAGFVYGYTHNLNDMEKLKLSVACGSATAYSYEIGTHNEVYRLINDIEVKEI